MTQIFNTSRDPDCLFFMDAGVSFLTHLCSYITCTYLITPYCIVQLTDFISLLSNILLLY